MDSEIALLTALALALTLQLRAHPPAISVELLNETEARAPVCMTIEFGMPCISMEPVQKD